MNCRMKFRFHRRLKPTTSKCNVGQEPKRWRAWFSLVWKGWERRRGEGSPHTVYIYTCMHIYLYIYIESVELQQVWCWLLMWSCSLEEAACSSVRDTLYYTLMLIKSFVNEPMNQFSTQSSWLAPAFLSESNFKLESAWTCSHTQPIKLLLITFIGQMLLSDQISQSVTGQRTLCEVKGDFGKRPL